MIYVVESVAILTGQISESIGCVRCDDRLPSERARIFLSAREFIGFLQWTGGCNERDTRTGCEWIYTPKMFYRHELLFVARITQVSLLFACPNMAHALLLSRR